MSWWLALILIHVGLAVVSAFLAHKDPQLFGGRKLATILAIICLPFIGPIWARFKYLDRSKFPDIYKARNPIGLQERVDNAHRKGLGE